MNHSSTIGLYEKFQRFSMKNIINARFIIMVCCDKIISFNSLLKVLGQIQTEIEKKTRSKH